MSHQTYKRSRQLTATDALNKDPLSKPPDTGGCMMYQNVAQQVVRWYREPSDESFASKIWLCFVGQNNFILVCSAGLVSSPSDLFIFVVTVF